MTERIETVGDLRRLLQNDADDTPLEVAPTPDISGWTHQLLACVHRDENGVVLALAEDTTNEDERDLTFTDETGPVRPV